jgi:hypothetical protein
MFGLVKGFGVPMVVLMEGVFWRENLLELAGGERCSTEDKDDDDKTENLACCC